MFVLELKIESPYSNYFIFYILCMCYFSNESEMRHAEFHNCDATSRKSVV
jgi:hypothetical protein